MAWQRTGQSPAAALHCQRRHSCRAAAAGNTGATGRRPRTSTSSSRQPTARGRIGVCRNPAAECATSHQRAQHTGRTTAHRRAHARAPPPRGPGGSVTGAGVLRRLRIASLRLAVGCSAGTPLLLHPTAATDLQQQHQQQLCLQLPPADQADPNMHIHTPTIMLLALALGAPLLGLAAIAVAIAVAPPVPPSLPSWPSLAYLYAAIIKSALQRKQAPAGGKGRPITVCGGACTAGGAHRCAAAAAATHPALRCAACHIARRCR